jgi:hypothetical protein
MARLSLCSVVLFAWMTAIISPAGAAFAQQQTTNQEQSSKHKITVTFDYDFTPIPACSTKVTKKCITLFNVYDISGPKRYKLFTIPTPENATGAMKGITGTSPLLLFESGKHLIAVTALDDRGVESSAATLWVTIP